MLTPRLILVLHDIRSTHNVGSLLRTANGLGVNKVIFSGYTPYPVKDDDERLPHLALKITNQIHKTALGAEKTTNWEQTHDSIKEVIMRLKKSGYTVCAIEQASHSTPLAEFVPNKKVALILGNELSGIDKTTLKLCEHTLEIPMIGEKESYNVAIAGAMALYHCRFCTSK